MSGFVEPVSLTGQRWVVLEPLARRTLGTFAEQEGRLRRYRDKQQARNARIAALEAQRAAEKARIAEERRLRRETARRDKDEREARHAITRAELKARARATKERQKAERIAHWQRSKRRHLLNARMAAYVRRLVKPFSTSR